MENKCLWKDGKFYPCDGFTGETHRNIPTLNDERYKYYCGYCGTDITKPTKPIVVKSNQTWVANLYGVDYLCLDPDSIIKSPEDSFMNDMKNKYEFHSCIIWKPFSEITLDDEIAKLRPIVIEGHAHKKRIIIYGVSNGMGIFIDHARYITKLRLAKPYELQEI